MKNKYISIAAVVLTAMGAFAPNANAAISWTLSPDGNAMAFGVTVVDGVVQINAAESAQQPSGIYGAGFTTTGTNFSMNFDSDLYSWDSYNANVGGGTGYWDAFIVTVSTTDFYWNLSHTDPITADASTFVWGGTNYLDGVLENYTCAPGCGDTISLSSGSPTTFFVSLVLDTITDPNLDTNYPSWGSFHVSVVPEPGTYAMLLAGLGLVGFSARRRFNNNGMMNNA